MIADFSSIPSDDMLNTVLFPRDFSFEKGLKPKLMPLIEFGLQVAAFVQKPGPFPEFKLGQILPSFLAPMCFNGFLKQVLGLLLRTFGTGKLS
jgi:hypothetical protein